MRLLRRIHVGLLWLTRRLPPRPLSPLPTSLRSDPTPPAPPTPVPTHPERHTPNGHDRRGGRLSPSDDLDSRCVWGRTTCVCRLFPGRAEQYRRDAGRELE